jgi:hypothetical protein
LRLYTQHFFFFLYRWQNRVYVHTPTRGSLMGMCGGSCANLLRTLKLIQCCSPQVEFCCSRNRRNTIIVDRLLLWHSLLFYFSKLLIIFPSLFNPRNCSSASSNLSYSRLHYIKS